MSCEFFSKITPTAIQSVKNIYLGDDLIIDLSSVVGDAVKFDPSALISVNLISDTTLQFAAFQAVADGANGNNFATGDVCAVVQSTLVDVIPRGRYYVMVRVVLGTLNQTYRLPIAVVLTNLI
jgi:hypothetical protein